MAMKSTRLLLVQPATKIENETEVVTISSSSSSSSLLFGQVQQWFFLCILWTTIIKFYKLPKNTINCWQITFCPLSSMQTECTPTHFMRYISWKQHHHFPECNRNNSLQTSSGERSIVTGRVILRIGWQ